MTIQDIREYVFDLFQKSTSEMDNLINFHTVNKFLFMAFSPHNLNVLGRIVANHEHEEFESLKTRYAKNLKLILSKTPSKKSHANVLFHIVGHFSKNLSKDEKQILLHFIDQFKNENISLSEILNKFKILTSDYDKTYLSRQTYFLLYCDSEELKKLSQASAFLIIFGILSSSAFCKISALNLYSFSFNA